MRRKWPVSSASKNKKRFVPRCDGVPGAGRKEKGVHMNKRFVKIVAIVLAVLMAVSVAAVGITVFFH